MFRKRTWKWVIVATIVASVLTAGATVVMAQTGEDTVMPRAGTLFARMPKGEGWGENDTNLADALGITPDELQAASDKARQAVIDKLLEDGTISQEQADAMAENERMGGIVGRGMTRYQGSDSGLDQGTLLAEALGISPEELAAAQQTAEEARMAQAVADGKITQEQADMMAARSVLKDYLNPEKLLADKLGISVEEFRDQMVEMRASAVQQAVEDGVITQEQADSFLSGNSSGLFGLEGFDRGGFHRHGGHFDGFQGPRPSRVPEVDSDNL